MTNFTLNEINFLKNNTAIIGDYERIPYDRVHKIGKLAGGYTILSTDKTPLKKTIDFFELFLSDPKNKALVLESEISRTQVFDIWGVQINYILVNHKYRNQGIAYSFYEFLLDKFGVIFSDTTQTKGSRNIWKKLAINHDVKLIRPNTNTRIPPKTVKNTKDAYRTENAKAYLIAFKKS